MVYESWTTSAGDRAIATTETNMHEVSFTAFAVSGELDLNRLAAKLSIAKKYRWEEPMRLNPVTFTPSEPADALGVHLYFFGSVVFLNCSDEIVSRFFDGLKRHLEQLKGQIRLPFRDDYRLEIRAESEPSITNDAAIMPHRHEVLPDIISFVIAKSVALELIEERIDAVFDEFGVLIKQLEGGKLELPDRRLARLASSVLGFKYTSISHIMVLDKPDSTWDNHEADRFYQTMADLFELSPRYQEIKHKSETLMDVTDVFSSLSHARRSARLEWIIIILIAFEVVMTIWDKFLK